MQRLDELYLYSFNHRISPVQVIVVSFLTLERQNYTITYIFLCLSVPDLTPITAEFSESLLKGSIAQFNQ